MSAVLRTLTAPAAAQIRRWVLGAFPRGQSNIQYDQPLGDPGLFVPDSVTWACTPNSRACCPAGCVH